MSRAFVNEDAGQSEEPRYSLPEPGSPGYEEAAAWALLEGADIGDSRSAEHATGFDFGDPRLIPQVQQILEAARGRGEDRVAQLAKRFLRQAGSSP
jgi:hypothetical protein